MDDPLGDLSDGSDSFFDDPKTTAKRASLTKTPDKKSITDLFNLGDSKPEEKLGEPPKKTDDWLGLGSTKDDLTLDTKKSPTKAPKLGKKISFEDDDDILGNLGLSKKPAGSTSDKPTEANRGEPEKISLEAKSKKIDFLESILGTTKTEEKKFSFDDILKESKAKMAETKPPAKTEPLVAKPVVEAPRESRRGRRPSGSLADPLGLFSTESKSSSLSQDTKFEDLDFKPKPAQTKSAPDISKEQSLPDWLGGAKIKTSKSEGTLAQKLESTSRRESLTKTQPENVKETVKQPQSLEISQLPQIEPTQIDEANLNSLLTQQKLAQSSMEFQNTAIALQQQESQLLMTLQLKKYEDRLAEMQVKQQEVLMKQEHQFNLLLERQFAKQQILENNMRLQQERINNHIQMLISQPPLAGSRSHEETESLKQSMSEENMKLYDNMVNSLKQRQLEEVFLLEESYKKQINLLEQSLEATEARLKSDTEKLVESFDEKLKVIAKEHDEEVEKYKKKLVEMEERHSEEIKQLRENHNRIIDEIKFEHATLVDNIKQSRQSETSLFSESTNYLQKLDSNIAILYSNSKELQELKGNLDKDYGVLTRAREESLKAKEEEIVLMRTTLDKCRQSAEEERSQLLSLVRSLEIKIAEQSQASREDQWALKQAAGTLTARTAALDREAEFNRASIEREREQLKTLKESMLAEQEKLILELTEQKLTLVSEKSRLETSSKLHLNYDTQKAKTEIDAAMQVAREATEMTDREREKLQRQQIEVEKLKRTLLDQERRLNTKESEIDNLMRDAERKIGEGERAMSESKSIENTYNERLRDLQNQLMAISVREKKLAEEKIAVSKERLGLHTMLRQTKRCGLCAVDAPKIDDFPDGFIGRFDLNQEPDNI